MEGIVMAHEITKTDKVLSVRQYTWHGLEDYVDDYLSIADTRKRVLDWDVSREPVYRKRVTVKDNDIVESYELVENQEFNVRSDNDEILASVPTERSEVTVDEMFQLAEVVQGKDSNVLVETAGSLRGGRDVFLLLKLNEPIKIKGDRNGDTLPFAALQNSFESGASFRFQPTNVRIVCKNTSRASDVLAEHLGANLVFAHTKNMAERIEEAQDALAAWRTDIQEWKLAKEFLVTQKVTIQGVNWFIDHFLPEPERITDRAKANLDRDRMDLLGELFNPMNEGIEQTALGLFEAASSWHEHVRVAIKQDSRFRRAVFAPNGTLATARDLALEAVSV